VPVSRRDAEGLAAQVSSMYADAEVRLLALIGKHLAAGHDAPGWAEAKLAELQMLRRRADAIMAQTTTAAVAATAAAVHTAYLRGAAAAEDDLRKLGKDTAGVRPRQAERATLALARALQDTLHGFPFPVVRQVADAYRDAVARAVSGTLTGASTRLQDAQVALDDLARRGLSGFTDTAGRRWSLQSYVEMATRSATAQAAVLGHLDRLEDAGINLFVVSDSPRECSRCQPWEGRILSRGPVAVLQRNVLTGAMERIDVDGTVEQATSAGLFHPNCTHSLSGFLPGATPLGRGTADPRGYAAQQEQRRLERGVREWKRREAVALTPEAQLLARVKVRQWQGRVREHVAANDLPRKRNRESLTAAR